MSFTDLVIILHSLLRWVVVILAVLTLGRALWGWFGQRPWQALDDRLGLFFTISLDMQFLVGLVLYLFLSPKTQAAFADFGAAMQTPGLRFFALEHVVWMIAALAVAHMGRVMVKRQADARKKHQRAAIFLGLAVLLIILGIPWAQSPLLPSPLMR